MKVVLLQDIKSWKKDDIVNVSDGYARNFSSKLAVEATDTKLKKYQTRRRSWRRKKHKKWKKPRH